MDPLHYVLLCLAAVITACQFVATNFPQYAALAHGISGVAASLMPMLGAMSKQLTAMPQPAPAPGALAAQVQAQTAPVAAALAAPVAPAPAALAPAAS